MRENIKLSKTDKKGNSMAVSEFSLCYMEVGLFYVVIRSWPWQLTCIKSLKQYEVLCKHVLPEIKVNKFSRILLGQFELNSDNTPKLLHDIADIKVITRPAEIAYSICFRCGYCNLEMVLVNELVLIMKTVTGY